LCDIDLLYFFALNVWPPKSFISCPSKRIRLKFVLHAWKLKHQASAFGLFWLRMKWEILKHLIYFCLFCGLFVSLCLSLSFLTSFCHRLSSRRRLFFSLFVFSCLFLSLLFFSHLVRPLSVTFLSFLVHLCHTLFLIYCLVLFASQLKMQMPKKHPFFCVLGRIFFWCCLPPHERSIFCSSALSAQTWDNKK